MLQQVDLDAAGGLKKQAGGIVQGRFGHAVRTGLQDGTVKKSGLVGRGDVPFIAPGDAEISVVAQDAATNVFDRARVGLLHGGLEVPECEGGGRGGAVVRGVGQPGVGAVERFHPLLEQGWREGGGVRRAGLFGQAGRSGDGKTGLGADRAGNSQKETGGKRIGDRGFQAIEKPQLPGGAFVAEKPGGELLQGFARADFDDGSVPGVGRGSGSGEVRGRPKGGKNPCSRADESRGGGAFPDQTIHGEPYGTQRGRNQT